ncbi:hypothetical protein [Haloarcula sp. Atlit-120R]|uniref:hypothetical protein n=1 Tax=Haloarcula sp. Atlit-120R TaxID=2282135 RepID=UPI0011C46396|nr:hypothetical protein [Haloarcula sp. Atlit-120R]
MKIGDVPESGVDDGFSAARRKVIAGIISISAFSQSGCLNFLRPPPVDKVDVNIIDVRPPSTGIGTASMILIIELLNTGSRSVPDPSLDFQVYIGDQSIATSSTSFPTIPANGESTERVEIIIKYSELASGMIQSMENDQSQIVIEGSIKSEGSAAEFSSSF